jgi:CheY-like chemotaxis protein
MQTRHTGERIPEIPEGFRVLIADDEEYNWKLIASILDTWKTAYDVATDGDEAVKLLSKNKYHLVLMDLRMPGTNGWDVAKFIRETLHLSSEQLPVLGISADTSHKIRTGKGELFNTFLVKPFTEEQLSSLVSDTLGLSSSESGQQTDSATQQQANSAIPDQSELSGNQDNLQQGDLSNLIRMAGEDMGFVEEMIIQFEKTTLEGLKEMETALEEGRFGTVRDLAHKLKPPSRHLELSRVLEQLGEIEKKAPRGNKILLRELINRARKSSTLAGESLHAQFRQLHKPK